MKGLELAEAYYAAYGRELIADGFPGYAGRIAAGLVGPGSECFGFDDEISRDHDFGPSFCLWLTPEDYRRIGSRLQRAYDGLPREFLGFAARRQTPRGGGRVGTLAMDAFYRSLIGRADAVAVPEDWLRIPESSLAAATNGRVFHDPLGRFSALRQTLLDYYPEDVRLKKMAARAAAMAQSGQYNFARCMRRADAVAARFALDEFMKNAMSIIFLLNRKYPPFYKWTRRALEGLPILGGGAVLFDRLAGGGLGSADGSVETIERVCGLVAAELRAQGVSESESDFLADHAEDVFARIRDANLRRYHIMEG